MPLFSSKTKTIVDTVAIRLVDDDVLPESIIGGAISAILSGDNLAGSIIDSVKNSPFRHFEKMYRYAESGDYFYGLPNARVLNSGDAAPYITAAIEDDLGFPVTVEYAYFRPINNVHVGWKVVTENFGYNHETNELETLTATKGYKVYLADLVSSHQIEHLYDADGLAQGVWGNSPKSSYKGVGVNPAGLVKSQSVVYGAALDESVIIKYVWTVPAIRNSSGAITTPAVTHEEQLAVTLSSYIVDREYHQARYRYTEGGTIKIGYWIYDPWDNTYPDLAGVFNPNYTAPGTYFPFAVIRRNKQNRATPELAHTDEFKSTKKLLSFLNIDFQEFSDEVHANPDIADVEQAVIMMGVPITSDDPIELEYLMRFFSDLAIESNFDPSDPLYQYGELADPEASGYAVSIEDADFRIIISYEGIKKKSRIGSIGAVGAYTNYATTEVVAGFNVQNSKPVRVISKQITEHVYEEIRIYNPKTRYDIYGGLGVIGQDDDDRLLVPLDYNIVRQMPIYSKEKLYYKSLHFVVNSRVTFKVKWYQTRRFRDVLKVVGIVATLFGFYQGYKLISLALAAGVTLTTILITMTINLIIKALSIAALTAVTAEVLGPEIAMAIAVLALVYTGKQYFDPASASSIATGKNLVDLVSGLGKGIQAYYKEKFQDLQMDYENFLDESKAAMEKLEAANELLSNRNLLDPMMFVRSQPLVILGETPDQFYNRTIHAGNVGVMAYDIIENFVEISLTLPTAQLSLGE